MLTIEQKLARDDIIKESKCHPNKIKHIAGQIEFDHAHLIANNMPVTYSDIEYQSFLLH